MKGLELCKKYYLAHGKPMIEAQFPEFAEKIAVGLVGEGSECLGYDDDISEDHDFEPAFCMFVTREDYENFGFRLERAYAKLEKNFEGHYRQLLQAVGGNRHGVIVIEDFYTRYIGSPTAPSSQFQWLSLPPEALLTASNGEIWRDDSGVFSETRKTLQNGYPEDVRLKKLAAHTIFAAQAGQYNYPRLIRRGETGAAQLAIYEFVRHTISAIYLLAGKYEPFYKWAYRGLREIKPFCTIEDALIGLTETDNSGKMPETKIAMIEDVAAMLIKEFEALGAKPTGRNDLDAYAYRLVNLIKDPELRNLNIMVGI